MRSTDFYACDAAITSSIIFELTFFPQRCTLGFAYLSSKNGFFFTFFVFSRLFFCPSRSFSLAASLSPFLPSLSLSLFFSSIPCHRMHFLRHSRKTHSQSQKTWFSIDWNHSSFIAKPVLRSCRLNKLKSSHGEGHWFVNGIDSFVMFTYTEYQYLCVVVAFLQQNKIAKHEKWRPKIVISLNTVILFREN